MDVVGVAAYFYDLTAELVADATKVAVQFGFDGRVYQWLSVFGAKYDMNVVFYKRLSHNLLVSK